MNKGKEFVGIDISKDFFDVFYRDGRHEKFANTLKGFKQFLKTLSAKAHCVMEQTGRYYEPLAFFLKEKEIAVSVENALVIKRFMQMHLKSTKTDKADAKLIQEYATVFEPKEWRAPSESVQQSRELWALSGQLKKQKTALGNQLHSIKTSGRGGKVVQQIIKRQVKEIKQDLKAIEKEMETLVKDDHQQLLTHLKTIPGIGKSTAMLLIIFTNGFNNFENSRQLSSYFGLAPTIKESGTSVKGRGNISKAGNRNMRSQLYICAWSACKHNKGCKAMYERMLIKGKSKNKALIAVSNKLLKQMMAVAKSQMPYDPNFKSVKCI
jgi:transposase